MYKVFFKDRAIFLLDPSECLKYQGIVLNWEPESPLKSWLEAFDSDESQEELLICAEDVEALFQSFKKCFRYMEAAGGLVWNGQKEFLAIHRLGKWDLPKGKVEKNETIAEAAVREVEEECGIHNLTIEGELESTYHTYRMKGKWVLKRTYWYRMSYCGNEALVPQTEEDIEKVEWLSQERLLEFKSDTYASILEVMECAV
ncbi:MAG: NUDIX hydrolase [Marinifilaceae bacterium]